MTTLLEQIREGMHVYDAGQNEVGTVDYVQFGDENPDQPGAETASVNPGQRDTHDSLFDNIINVFKPDDLPEVIRARLLRRGFIRVDAPGLFNADRYISPDQILSVIGNKVMLKIRKEELIQQP